MKRKILLILSIIISCIYSDLHAQNITRPNIIGPAGLEVNSYTGNLFYQRSDLVIPAQGMNLDITFSFNSTKTALNYGYGHGWTFAYNMLYELDSTNIIIRRADSRVDTFAYNGNTFDAPAGIFDTLEVYQPNQYRLTAKNGMKYFFDAPNHQKVTSIVDRYNNQIILGYTDSLLTSIADGNGRTLNLSYTSGLLTQITDNISNPSRTLSYQYNSYGNMVKFIDVLGNEINYTYDAYKRIRKIKDKNNNVIRIYYNDNHAVAKLFSSLSQMSIEYNQTNYETKVSQIVNQVVQETTYTFDSTSNVIQKTGNCCGYSVSYTYDEDKNIKSIIDANGNTTQYVYDERGNVLTETDPFNDSITYTYDTLFNQITNVVDKKGFQTSYIYDTNGNLLQRNQPLGVTEYFTYDNKGNRLSWINENGDTSTYVHNPYGYLTTVNHPIGYETFTYNNVGNLISITDPNNNTTHFTYDALDRMTTSINALGDTISIIYDGNNNITSETDYSGNVATYTYDALNRQTAMHQPLSISTIYKYDEAGNIIELTDPKGNLTGYTYNSNNLLDTETNAQGFSKFFSYDNNGNLTSKTDFKNNPTNSHYDALDRLISITNALGDSTSFDYDANGNRTAMTDANGHPTTFAYDSLDRIINVYFPIGSMGYTYDANSNLATETNPNLQTTIYSYDKNNRLKSISDPLGNTTTFKYDLSGNMILETNALGDTTLYTYNALDQLIMMVDPESDTTQFSYDAVGNPTAITYPNTNIVSLTYDEVYRLTITADLIGTIENFTYDLNSNLLTSKNGNNLLTAFSYDELDRITIVTDPVGQQLNYTYDPNWNLTKETDRNGNTTFYTYDQLDQQIAVINTLTDSTTYAFDPVGNIINILDANGNNTSYAYDNMNLITMETFADTTTKHFTYDNIGNVLTRTDNNGSITNYTYDALNRLTLRDYPGSNDDSFTYDAKSRMVSTSNSTANITFDYDKADRLLNETINSKTTTYVYDIAANQRTVTYPGGRQIQEDRDWRNRLEAIKEGSVSIATFVYDPADRLTQRNYANGTQSNTTYNNNDWITNLQHSKNSTLLAGFNYAHDLEGNKHYEEKTLRPTHSEQYLYDNIYRLTEYKEGTLSGSNIPTPLTHTQFNYDALGNRISTNTDGIPTSYSVNKMNEYTAISGGSSSTPIYNATGNLTDDGTHTYTYDFENRLISVDNDAIAHYSYDPLRRRIQKTTPTDTVNYYYDGDKVIEERNGNDEVIATYVYGSWIDDILTMDQDTDTYYYHHNALGSVTLITDIAGAVAERYEYDAYGKVSIYDSLYSSLNSSAIGNPYLFTGRRLEQETSMYYYRARHYDPMTGRFLQRDPLGYVDGMNRYEYVTSNPRNRVDPMGTETYQLEVINPLKKGSKNTDHWKERNYLQYDEGQGASKLESYRWAYGFELTLASHYNKTPFKLKSENASRGRKKWIVEVTNPEKLCKAKKAKLKELKGNIQKVVDKIKSTYGSLNNLNNYLKILKRNQAPLNQRNPDTQNRINKAEAALKELNGAKWALNHAKKIHSKVERKVRQIRANNNRNRRRK